MRLKPDFIGHTTKCGFTVAKFDKHKVLIRGSSSVKFQTTKEFVMTFFKLIFKHNIGALAAVIAFFGFSAMIPLLMLLVYGASVLVPHPLVEHFLTGVLRSYVPTIPDEKMYFGTNLIRLVNLGPSIGVFGVVGLFWSTVGGFVSLQQILDVIWEVHRRRSFFKQYLMGFLMLGILFLLTIASSLISAVSPTWVQRFFNTSLSFPILYLIQRVSDFSFPVFLFLTLYACYRFLPSTRLRNTYLVVGAAVATIAIYASRLLFMLYTRHLGNYELIYGSLTFIMLFTFWFYIVSIIILLGAGTAKSLHAMHETKPEPVSRAS